MKIMMQLLQMSTGVRSEMFTGTRQEIAQKMADHVPEKEQKDNAVIIIMDELEDEMSFSRAPILTMDHFIELFAGVDNNE